MKDIDFVLKTQKEITLLGISSSLLNWDQQTLMPKKGIKTRAKSISYISKLIHHKITDNELFQSVERLKKSSLPANKKLMIEKLSKEIEKERKIPKKHVVKLSKTISLANSAWLLSRKKNNFNIFKPLLEELVNLKIKETRYLNMEGHPYNSLLDNFEEGMTVEKLDPIFKNLKKGIKNLLKKIKSSELYKKNENIFQNKKFSSEKQMALVKDVTKRMGLKENFSRIDFSEHPFTTTIGINDVRITTALRENPLFAFESSVHEAGHALYELGMPKKYFYSILGGSPSFGMHESQSRFWENIIGKSKPFWKFYFKKFKKEFNIENTFEEFYRKINKITPGAIRVESDEVHYCLHIILRYEIEKDLIEGKIKVKNLPQLWNKKMKELIGVSPKNDVEGVLQDVHWSDGCFGYFPTYAIGTIYASQLYKALIKSLGKKSIESEIEKGRFRKIIQWLKKNIHQYGRFYLSEELIKKICKEPLNAETYLEYLNKKYKEIYHF